MAELTHIHGRAVHAPRGEASARRWFEAGAIVLGVAAGVLFADPVLAAAGNVWHAFLLPAYQTIIENGLLAWCM